VTAAVTLNDVPKPTNDVEDLRKLLIGLDREESNQVVLERESGEALFAQVLGGQAWLMYLMYDGDPGFTTRNPSYAGSPDDILAFTLPNGQTDEYPAGWWLPDQVVFRALEYFYAHGGMAPWLTWNDDSLEWTYEGRRRT
jgi:hypothetical protein